MVAEWDGKWDWARIPGTLPGVGVKGGWSLSSVPTTPHNKTSNPNSTVTAQLQAISISNFVRLFLPYSLRPQFIRHSNQLEQYLQNQESKENAAPRVRGTFGVG